MRYGLLARALFLTMDLLNAYFEDHAEHEYMGYVAENPALESEPFQSTFGDDYGHFGSLADLVPPDRV